MQATAAPDDWDDWDDWDQVTEASLDVPSGRVVVAGCTDYVGDAARIAVAPGMYAARVYFGGLDLVDDTMAEGSDRYKVVLWPDQPRELCVLKAYIAGAPPA